MKSFPHSPDLVNFTHIEDKASALFLSDEFDVIGVVRKNGDIIAWDADLNSGDYPCTVLFSKKFLAENFNALNNYYTFLMESDSGTMIYNWLSSPTSYPVYQLTHDEYLQTINALETMFDITVPSVELQTDTRISEIEEMCRQYKYLPSLGYEEALE